MCTYVCLHELYVVSEYGCDEITANLATDRH